LSEALDLLAELKGGEDHLTGTVVERKPAGTGELVTLTFTATLHSDWLAPSDLARLTR
jgi:hypothetical protein